jgi:membrane-associated phospholipid phosphatase
MPRRLILYSILVSLVLTLLGIFLFDQPVAAFVQRVDGRSSALLLKGTTFLEIITGISIAKYALTCALLGLGLLLMIWKITRSAAWMLLFVGSSQIITRIIVSSLKPVFERLRPFEVIKNGDWDWKFFNGHGDAFPSGHGAYFWGLYFPLAFLFPRYRVPLAIFPVFISIARIGINAHWCSDVLGSMAVAGLVTFVFTFIFAPLFNRPVATPTQIEVE